MKKIPLLKGGQGRHVSEILRPYQAFAAGFEWPGMFRIITVSMLIGVAAIIGHVCDKANNPRTTHTTTQGVKP